jgi:hypothetical protein
VDLATELEASLREWFAAGPAELRENDARISPLAGLSWEVRGARDKPLLHLWSGERNLTRRVLAIAAQSTKRLTLAVERFGRTKPDRLEFVRTEYERPARDVSREEFAHRLTRVLACAFPDEALESISTAADLEHSLSGNYPRGILRRGSSRRAFLAVADGASAEASSASLTFGLLWFERARQTGKRSVTGLRLILPKGKAGAALQQLPALRADCMVEVFEHDAASETITRCDPAAGSNIRTRLVPHREAELLLEEARRAIELLPGIRSPAVSLHPAVDSREVVLRFRGLAFARWHEHRVYFGTTDAQREFTPATRSAFEELLRQLEVHRHSLASDRRHRLYRGQAERWLESIVLEDVTRIDAALDPRFAYTQVIADAGDAHGILDVLAVTRAGRLAIIELKAGEHIHLPLQAAGYWLRVRQHLQQGNFPRAGYFPGVQLSAAPPIVYLVAPALRFHPATDTLLRFLSREMEVARIGLAENWRRNFRVVMRQ